MEIQSLKKGDCFFIEQEKKRYGLIIHHVIPGDTIYYACLIIGQVFDQLPDKSEALSVGLLGYKYLSNEVNTIDHLLKSSKDYDDTLSNNTIRYDLLLVDSSVLLTAANQIQLLSSFNFAPDFFPRPSFQSRQDQLEELCDLIASRIKLRGIKSKEENAIYDAFSGAEILL